jgi:hypothetical protein
LGVGAVVELLAVHEETKMGRRGNWTSMVE